MSTFLDFYFYWLGVATAALLGSFAWMLMLGLLMNAFWRKHEDGYKLFCMVLNMRNERDELLAEKKYGTDEGATA